MKKILITVLAFSLSAFCSTLWAKDVEKRVEDLLSKMTLEEKIGQMNQVNYFDTDNKQLISDNFDIPLRQGRIGSLLNVMDPAEVNRLQKIAITESRLGVPLIIGRDVIHGFKTIFPIPLGQAASFNPDVVEEGARVAAKEAKSVGVNWTFAPMMDISRDARWGRIAESIGEDPYLTGVLGAAMVRGFQGGGDLSHPDAIAACVKHFVGYGASEGGRDYNSTNIPPRLLRNVYLAPFQKAIQEAGVATVMTSFNDNDGVPASGDDYILKTILRDEWKFDGFIVSDWASVGEMIPHGFAKDAKEAALKGVKGGVEMEMESRTYLNTLKELVGEGKVSEKELDDAVRNILRIKFRLGLFENPYIDTKKKSVFYADSHLKAAKKAAVESAILLKNENNILPLSSTQKIAVIGPMADAAHDQLGTWIFDGDKNYTVTPVKALNATYKNLKYVYEPALAYSRDTNTANFAKAKAAAQESDVAVIFVGEESILSGEAHSLSNINLIGAQSELIKEVKSVGKPVVLVVMAGRPLTIERDLSYVDAVLYNFHPGTMGGPAIWDLLLGKENPSGKLPVTFVREVGQIPMYYNHNNTGRPAPANVKTLEHIEQEAGQTSLGNTSFYLDSGQNPLYPFGFGLSYSTFEYSDIQVSSSELTMDGKITISATITNTSNVDGTEVAQLYVRDLVGSITRPVRELKGFERVMLKGGESKVVSFDLTADNLAFYGKDMKRKAEAGDFKVWIGGNSNATLESSFVIK